MAFSPKSFSHVSAILHSAFLTTSLQRHHREESTQRTTSLALLPSPLFLWLCRERIIPGDLPLTRSLSLCSSSCLSFTYIHTQYYQVTYRHKQKQRRFQTLIGSIKVQFELRGRRCWGVALFHTFPPFLSWLLFELPFSSLRRKGSLNRNNSFVRKVKTTVCWCPDTKGWSGGVERVKGAKNWIIDSFNSCFLGWLRLSNLWGNHPACFTPALWRDEPYLHEALQSYEYWKNKETKKNTFQ